MATRMRFVHCGAFQIDSTLWEGPEEWETFRNEDLWHTFEAVLNLCRTEKVDCLFISGDLFEQEYVRYETIKCVVKKLAQLEGTRIFIAPGKKDPLVSTSVYRLALWPDNVHIFSKGISSVKISTLNATIYGAGWTAYRQEVPFLDGFHTTNDGTYQLMLIHAAVNTIENQNTKFRTIMPEQIAASGLDYLALGYQEEWSGILQSGRTFWADCGSPEARSFREKGPHGVVIGEINDERSARFEFRELGQRRYVEKGFSVPTDIEVLAK
ncbi:MAG: hypothetical protein Q8911_14355, partial [Bacillota bacterium]|nr:hypothetical protein [Bacillota bacterium]